jgi:hypothetical protein
MHTHTQSDGCYIAYDFRSYQAIAQQISTTTSLRIHPLLVISLM